jgi:DNA invertase Pin-like site-specific DNA recombinase
MAKIKSKKSRPVVDSSKVVAYIRVSTEDQHLGPEAQLAAINVWATRQNVEVVAVHRDLGVSGATPLADCPGLMAALNDLGVHGAGSLVVAKRDRLARDVMKAAMVEASAEKVGARVVSAAGEGDGTDPAAQLMRTIVDAFAQYERAMIAARTRAALAVKKMKGERTGGIPYGFSVDADGHLISNEDERKAIALARKLSSQGMSLRAICAAFREERIIFRNFNWNSPSLAQRLLQAEC